MKIYIVGIGPGDTENITVKASNVIKESDLIIGHTRMLKVFESIKCEKRDAYLSNDIKEIIGETEKEIITILVSGDVGFFSASRNLLKVLNEYNVELIPGISSIVYFSSKVGLNWEDMNIISLHGRNTSILGSIKENEKTFLLMGGENTVENLLKDLKNANVENILIYVGENLSYENEKITIGNIESLINQSFSTLSVVIIKNKSQIENYAYRNIPDNEFIRGKVPMTKAEVRNLVIGKLALKKGDIFYDIGAGTGSISIEAANLLTYGEVYAVEKNTKAVDIIKLNKDKFNVYNLKIIEGESPYAIKELKAPDKVFIGGSGGKLEEIIKAVIDKNPKVRIVVTGISLETITEAFKVFKKLELSNIEIVQVAISKAKNLGEYNMMIGENPIYIFSGDGKGE